MKKGDRVYYNNPNGKKENGIVKRVADNGVFVVYHCADDWKNYEQYTAALTPTEKLSSGWVDKDGHLMPEYCDHHYIPTNAKWQSATQRQCCFCGDTID